MCLDPSGSYGNSRAEAEAWSQTRGPLKMEDWGDLFSAHDQAWALPSDDKLHFLVVCAEVKNPVQQSIRSKEKRQLPFFLFFFSRVSHLQTYAIFGAATLFLIAPVLSLPLSLPSSLRASSGYHSNGPPMGDREPIIMDHGIQKLKDMILFSVNTGSGKTFTGKLELFPS